MKNYLKPELQKISVSALERIAATFGSFDAFSDLSETITTYQFVSGFATAGGNK